MHIRNIGTLCLLLAVLGVGCPAQEKKAEGFRAPQLAASNTAASSEAESVRNPIFEDGSTYVLLQGALFSDATTTLSLHLDGHDFQPLREITGRFYEEGGRVGSIFGSYPQDRDWEHPVFTLKSLEEYFRLGQGFATVHAAWSQDGTRLEGTLDWGSGDAQKPFVLQVIPQSAVSGSVNVVFRHTSQVWSEKPWVDLCEYAVDYPVVNPVVDAAVRKTLLEAGTTSFEDAADRFTRACHVEPIGRPTDQGNRSYRISTEVAMNQDDVVSFFFHIASWGGGAHEVFESKALTVDLRTGKTLMLADLIKPERLHDFVIRAGRKTLDQFYEQWKSDTSSMNDRATFDELEDFNDLKAFTAATTTMSVAEQVKRYGGFKRFYLTPKGLVIFYNSYDLGIWANTPHVLLPYKDIKEFMRRDVVQE